MVKLTEKELKEKEKYFYQYMGKGNNATLSEVDSNANVSSKNVATFGCENNKDINVQVNTYILAKRVEKLFGKELAEQLYKDLEEGSIYIHDNSGNSAGMPYCVAIDTFPFIMNGDIPLGGNSKAPKHLASFIGAYVNLIFLIAGQFNGAVADVSVLNYFDYFARKDYGKDYLETHTEMIKNFLQQLVYTINAPSGGRGYQSVFYNTSIFDENYFKALFGEMVLPDFTHPQWESVNKLQKFFMKWFNEEREKALLTFPVITFAGQTENGKFKDEDFKDFMTTEMSEGNSFFIYSSDSVDSLASCCRLRNEIEVDTFSYSLGGTSLQSGSKKVITLNMNRIVQKGINLDTILDRVHKYLVSFDDILYEEFEKGLLTVYNEGYISLDKQYLTVGVNALTESAEYLGYEISDNKKYKKWLKDILVKIDTSNKQASKEYTERFGRKTKINLETVPAENLAIKLAKKDKEDGLVVPRDCYSSYFYNPEDNNLNVFDKFNLYSKDILDSVSGGTALHLALQENLTKVQWEKIVDYATDVGCNYFCFNVKSTCCEEKDCGYINKETKDHCTRCGSSNVCYATRVVGYLTKIPKYSEGRQKEAGIRYYHKKDI